MQYLKSDRDIAQMRRAGLLVWQAHQVAAELVKPGITTVEINAAVEKFILENKAIPLFKGVPGKVPFPAVACISVNEQIVHGIPGLRPLKEGDIVSGVIGCRLNGWCGHPPALHSEDEIERRKQRQLAVT